MTRHRIRRVVVLGAGMMGSQIAAHCVNAGLEVTLLDMASPDGETGAGASAAARKGVERLRGLKPAPLAMPEWADRIQTGNFEEHMHLVGQADWICEAVVERLDIKHALLAKVAEHRSPGSIVSTNTSGLPISEILEGVAAAMDKEEAEEFGAHFLGTHFFNPPRYMKLLELIPTTQTSPDVLRAMRRFCESRLGKGVVVCRDTPNFIANRVGVFSMAAMLPWVFDGRLGPEEVDYLTGTLTGYSKAATFRTADLAGLDVLAHVARNLHPAIPDDERREVFNLPEAFNRMVEHGLLGNKAGAGFYKKTRTEEGGVEYRVLDPATMEYRTQRKPAREERFAAVAAIEKAHRDPAARLAALVELPDEAGAFVWDVHRELLCYAANRLGEISDSVEAVDRAMRWGFNWQLGPFERWDALGVARVVERLRGEGHPVPEVIERMLEAGCERFYTDGAVYDPAVRGYVPRSPAAEGALTVADLHDGGAEVFGNRSLGLYDMGGGVALLAIRTPHNTLGSEFVASTEQVCRIVRASFDALVIGHDGEDFSYGANLMEAGKALKARDVEAVRGAVEGFQAMVMRFRYEPFPVVVAASGRAFGGGCELMMHADRVVAHHELYAGLVELGVGLIPAGGGTKELLHRAMSRIHFHEDADPLPALRAVFKTISMAKVSDSAPRAREIGYLREADVVVMNRDLLLASARNVARTLADLPYEPPAPPRLHATGQTGLAALRLMAYVIGEGGFATAYDLELAMRVARILTGGELSEPQWVEESWVLRLEREEILAALADPRTHARMEHMLTTGKPLRN